MYVFTDKEDSYEGLSLAEAFAKRRADFEVASKRRQEEAKRRAQEKTSKLQSQQGPGHMSKTLSSWKQSRGLNSGSRADARQGRTIFFRFYREWFAVNR